MGEDRDTPTTPPRQGQPADAARHSRAARSLPGTLAATGRWVREDSGRRWEDLLSEFMAAILTWAGIGWLVDRWLGTAPWFLVFGAVLGNGLGIYLLWLRSDPARGRRGASDDSDGGTDDPGTTGGTT
jgi:hypothetical protein